ncbi:MAG: head GIN domain-containing protein [Flavobacteriales bacterium]
MKTVAILTLVTVLSIGCNMNCIEGEGPVEERVLDVASFTGIETGSSLQVTIEKGTTQQITVRAQPNLIDLLNTEVKGDVWRIRTSQCWSSGAEFTVHIITPSQISSIEAHGSADVITQDVFGSGRTKLSTAGSSTISVAGINEKKLDLDISGSGAITIRGTCSELSASLSGSGDLHGTDLTANEADVKVSGSGSATLIAITKLYAKVSGSGKVRYGGKPNVESKISGSGSVAPLE